MRGPKTNCRVYLSSERTIHWPRLQDELMVGYNTRRNAVPSTAPLAGEAESRRINGVRAVTKVCKFTVNKIKQKCIKIFAPFPCGGDSSLRLEEEGEEGRGGRGGGGEDVGRRVKHSRGRRKEALQV